MGRGAAKTREGIGIVWSGNLPTAAAIHRSCCAEAGRFHLGHAIAFCAAGEVHLARGAVGALSVVWSEGRALVLDCDALAAVW